MQSSSSARRILKATAMNEILVRGNHPDIFDPYDAYEQAQAHPLTSHVSCVKSTGNVWDGTCDDDEIIAILESAKMRPFWF